MPIIKKLLFAPLSLVCFYLFFLKVGPLLNNTNLIFSFNVELLTQLGFILLLLILGCLFFVIFAALALDWMFVTPVIIIISALPIFMLPGTSGFILAGTGMAALVISYFSLEKKMASYFTFQATALLSPSVKGLMTLLLIVISIAFYLNINADIQKNGFSIPDSIIDASINLLPQESTGQTSLSQQPTLSKEQVSLLRQNPALLKQYGLDPKILDEIEASQNNPSGSSQSQANIIKPVIKSQLDTIIKPYLPYIPAVLAVSFYFSLQFIAGFLSLLVPVLILIIFWTLEKTGFTKFEIEQREVKKLVV